jgi:hypothetical protein
MNREMSGRKGPKTVPPFCEKIGLCRGAENGIFGPLWGEVGNCGESCC